MKLPGIHLKKAYRLFSGIVIASLVSCASEQDRNPEKVEKTKDPVKQEVKIPDAGSLNGDTINLGGKFVLFFAPQSVAGEPDLMTPAEMDAYKKTSEALMDSLSLIPGIKSAFTTAKYFRIYSVEGNSMIISKSAVTNQTGVLVTDGNQPPTIRKGILRVPEYQKLFKEYFFLQ